MDQHDELIAELTRARHEKKKIMEDAMKEKAIERKLDHKIKKMFG